MRTIKTKLLLTILPSLAGVWLLCSGALYLHTRDFLYESLDQELRLLADDAHWIASRNPEHMPKRFQDRALLFAKDGSFYFQAWSQEGQPRTRSQSLGTQSLQYHGPYTEEKVFTFETLEDGTHLRIIRHQLTPRQRRRGDDHERRRRSGRAGSPPTDNQNQPRPKINVTVGRDTAEVEATLLKLRSAILFSTLAGLGVAGLVVVISVRRGLRPLGTLSDKLSDIGSQNLNERLDSADHPQELHVVSDKVNDFLARLEDAFERERRFGSDLAHEIRTPTAEIRALSEVGLTWPDEFGKEELEQIFQSAQRMEHTTQAILDLTRLTSTSELKLETVELRPLVEKLLPDTPPITVLGETPTIQSHPSFLQIILQNLIGNAAAYAPEGDEIVITLNEDSLSIENTAPDLTQEDLPLLFERFWRKDSSRTSTSHAGLGLRLVSVCAEKLLYTITPALIDGRLKFTIQGLSSSPQQSGSA